MKKYLTLLYSIILSIMIFGVTIFLFIPERVYIEFRLLSGENIEKRGNIERNEMYGTFNMGVGMVVVIDSQHAEKVLNLIEDAYEIGEITEGTEKIQLI